MAANDSWQLSEQLLEERASGMPAQYGALIFDDPIIRHIPDSLISLNSSLRSLGPGKLVNMLPLLSGVMPRQSVVPSPLKGVLSGGFLSQLSTPEIRVVSRLIDRFQHNPGAAAS